jgi:hypothetical protein
MRWTRILILAGGLLAAAAPPLAAQAWEDYDYENLEFRGIGIDLGWMMPPRVDAALFGGVRVDLGNLGPNVRVRPGIAYWASELRRGEVERLSDQLRNVCLRQRELASECPALDLGTIRMSDLSFNADAQYEWTNTPFLFVPYLGGGAGIHLFNGRGEAINGTFIEDFLDSVSPSLNLLGGARIPLVDAFELNAEARYVLASDIRHAVVTVGATWLLAPRRGSAPRPTAARIR